MLSHVRGGSGGGGARRGAGRGNRVTLRLSAGRRVERARVCGAGLDTAVATPRDTERAHQVSRAVAARRIVHEPQLAQRVAAAHAGGEVADPVLSRAATGEVVGWGWRECGVAVAVWCGARSGEEDVRSSPVIYRPIPLQPVSLPSLPLPPGPLPCPCRAPAAPQAHRCSARVCSCAAW